MEIFKIFRKFDVCDVPVILEDKFKIIINVNFKNLKIIKVGRFL
jgi:hypothetical protein